MASWSGLIHSACFFLIGTKLWYYGKRFGYSTQIQFFRDRFQSNALGYLLFPILVGLVDSLRGAQYPRLGGDHSERHCGGLSQRLSDPTRPRPAAFRPGSDRRWSASRC